MDECGFKIVCLDCKRMLDLKRLNNYVFKMKGITVAPIDDHIEIGCECGNIIFIRV